MDIAGGTYWETCESPPWQGLWGSGVRAAMAVSSFGSHVSLHSYAPEASRSELRILSDLVSLKLHARSREIAFAYFHPLSSPFIEPPVSSLIQQPDIHIEGASVLRFGFLEGSARVNGDRVVYDPQSPQSPGKFTANGSTAQELALVMNEHEFTTYTECSSYTDGVRSIFSAGEADVVVIKKGVYGAFVFTSNAVTHIPPYQSSAVFKIGTGDIFSAIFALAWAKEHRDPILAADLASKAVSVYCDAPDVSLRKDDLQNARPYASCVKAVEVIAATDTLGRKYTLQEAVHSIRTLGITASAQAESFEADGRLIIADGLSPELVTMLCSSSKHTVVLDEEGNLSPGVILKARLYGDFASAVYQVCMKRF